MMKKLLFTVALFIATITFGQTGPTNIWVDRPADNAILEIGMAYTVSADYDAGDDGAGLEYEVGSATDTNILQYSIQLYTGVDQTTRQWKDGKNIASTLNTHSGTSATTSISYTIPTLVPTADLTTGDYYVMRLGYQNSNGGWSTGAAEIPITIVAAPVADSFVWNPDNATYPLSTTMDVGVTYTSDTDIAIGGLKFTMWTITGGTYNFPTDDPDEGDVSMFSDVWHGAFSNTTVLTAGTNVSTIITINVPASTMNGGEIRPSTDLGSNWDPNAGDAGNKYIDHATSPASLYYYQFRSVAGTDANFTPATYPQTIFTISSTAGVKDYERLKIGVYPNPTSETISVSEGDAEVKSVKIYNVLGKEVLKSKKATDIDVSGLSKGIYLLKTNNGRLSKFIKQ